MLNNTYEDIKDNLFIKKFIVMKKDSPSNKDY